MTELLVRGVRRIGTHGTPVDVRIVRGRIAEIGAAGTLPTGDRRAEVVDAPGAWIGPGLRDHHTHFDQWALLRRRIDLSSAVSAEHAAELLASAGASAATGDVIIGHGYRDGLWSSPARQSLLDVVGAGRPVVAVSGDLHAMWCNTAAIAHLTAAIGRPLHTGSDGIIREQDAFDATGALSALPDQALDAAVADAARSAAARGVTAVVDLEMRWGLDRWCRRVQAGIDSLRVASGVYANELDDAIGRRLRTGAVIDGTDGLVTMGPFKVVADGSLGTRTAAMSEPYSGVDGEGLGALAMPVDELRPLLLRAVGAGLEPAVHAIGDRANTLALDLFEAVGAAGRIEHAQLVNPGDIPRFARLGVTASVQPEHAMDDRDLAERYWHGRTAHAFPYGALEQAGVRLLFGSDAPVAPLDPWITMAAAIGRSRDGRDPWHAEQRMSSVGAWRASTGGAVAAGVGDVADIVLTADDPLTADPEDLRTMHVLGTAIAGRLTYRNL